MTGRYGSQDINLDFAVGQRAAEALFVQAKKKSIKSLDKHPGKIQKF